MSKKKTTIKPVKKLPLPPGPPKGRHRDEGRNPAIMALLKRKKITQRALAKKIGATPSSLSHVFRGRKGISLVRATAIAKALGVKLETFTGALGNGN